MERQTRSDWWWGTIFFGLCAIVTLVLSYTGDRHGLRGLIFLVVSEICVVITVKCLSHLFSDRFVNGGCGTYFVICALSYVAHSSYISWNDNHDAKSAYLENGAYIQIGQIDEKHSIFHHRHIDYYYSWRFKDPDDGKWTYRNEAMVTKSTYDGIEKDDLILVFNVRKSDATYIYNLHPSEEDILKCQKPFYVNDSSYLKYVR